MGKNLIQQARGKGGPRYRAPSFRYKGEVQYPKETQQSLNGEVVDLVHCQGHSAPLVKIRYEDGEELFNLAPEGIAIGDTIKTGPQSELKDGNVLPLRDIPEGTSIYNIESYPGDGGKFARSSGTFAKLVAKLKDRAIVLLPSKKERDFILDCRATIGMIAGSGRTEKPFLKAGTRYYKMAARNKLYPIVSGTSMNAVEHPFGGKGSHTKPKPTQASRHAPPGRKVGKIAPKRTGRRNR